MRPVPAWDYDPMPPFIAAAHGAGWTGTYVTLSDAIGWLTFSWTDASVSIVDARGEFVYAFDTASMSGVTCAAACNAALAICSQTGDIDGEQAVLAFHELLRDQMYDSNPKGPTP